MTGLWSFFYPWSSEPSTVAGTGSTWCSTMESRARSTSRTGLAGPVFEPLKEPGYFERFFLDGGTVAWPGEDGAQLGPEREADGPGLVAGLRRDRVGGDPRAGGRGGRPGPRVRPSPGRQTAQSFSGRVKQTLNRSKLLWTRKTNF